MADVTLQFCKECSNILYPREHSTQKKLILECLRCSYQEDTESACVYSNVLIKATECVMSLAVRLCH